MIINQPVFMLFTTLNRRFYVEEVIIIIVIIVNIIIKVNMIFFIYSCKHDVERTSIFHI